ncbi:hypothetical protein CPT_Moonbeam161 [Bacillus phage Moonbeam]|uniref:Uncharacterized protein n=1 Tax=Bacillus phage Moonbeam TaxID=1540091 RepID=A0A0A0RPM0_9CAUD|nr:hypothetical protein CPT_Moonbeam161 [Bacillus phage Moonbeam]AIW03559.1 hypothetical protein CPT_Moonbeam161 [Bacillus phage Moonbeam]
MKVMTLVLGNQKATVKEENGVVSLIRGDQETNFSPKHTFESVTEDFKAFGWEAALAITPGEQHEKLEKSWLMGERPGPPIEIDEFMTVAVPGKITEITSYSGGTDDKVVERAVSQEVPVAVQKEVDEYIRLHEQIAELNKRAKKLKEGVRGYMEDNDKKEIYGTEGKKVVLQPAAKTNSTSTYTDYEYHEVATVLNEHKLEEVSEMRINADKLNSLVKTKKLPTEVADKIKKMKIAMPGTPKFTVKS